MASRPGARRSSPPGLPVRTVASRVTFGSLLAIGVVLLVLTKLDLTILTVVSDRVGDVSAPALRLLYRPVLLARQAADRVGRLLALEAENDRLREENRRLLVWRAEATRLGVENQSLREVLRVPTNPRARRWGTAQIVGDSGASFVQSRLIDGGRDRGFDVGMPVVTEAGLVGLIVTVGQHSARVLLITDFSSRIPVVIEGSRDRAILAGDNGPMPALQFLPSTADARPGQHVQTSGDGGLLPAGLLVGEVASVGGEVLVRPIVDWGRLDWVAVLQVEPVATPENEPLASR